MAIDIKDGGAKASPKKAQPQDTEKAAPPIEAKPYEFELELIKATSGGVASLKFKRLKFGGLKQVFSHDKPSQQLAAFIENTTEPRLSRSDIEALHADDVEAAAEIMDQLIGFAGAEDNETGVYEDAPARPGRWDAEQSTYWFGFPLSVKRMSSETTEEVVLDHIRFRKDVTFRENAGVLNATEWTRRIESFVTGYGVAPHGIPLVQSIVDDFDASDVLHIRDVVMLDILGNSTKPRRWKRL